MDLVGYLRTRDQKITWHEQQTGMLLKDIEQLK